MTSLQQLENKIREALPYLKYTTNGAIIYKPHWNVFLEEFKGFEELTIFKGKVYDEEGYEVGWRDIDEGWLISHPILLNDVLLWLSKLLAHEWDVINLQIPASFDKGYFYFKNTFKGAASGSPDVDLSSPYLSEQSNELIEFLNSF